MILRPLAVILALVNASYCFGTDADLSNSDHDGMRVQNTLNRLRDELNILSCLKEASGKQHYGLLREQLSFVAEIYASLFNKSVDTIPLVSSGIMPTLALRYLGSHSSYVMSRRNVLKGPGFDDWINQQRCRGPVYGEVKTFSSSRINTLPSEQRNSQGINLTDAGSYLLTLKLGSHLRRIKEEAVYVSFLGPQLPQDESGRPFLDFIGPEGRRLSLYVPLLSPLSPGDLVSALQNQCFVNGRHLGSACNLDQVGISQVYATSRFSEGLYGLKYDVELDEFGIEYGIFTLSSIGRTYREVFEVNQLTAERVLCSFGLDIILSQNFNPHHPLPLMWFSLDDSCEQEAFYTWLHADWSTIEQGSHLNLGLMCLSKLLKCLAPEGLNLPRFSVELSQTSRIVTDLLNNRRKLKISVCVDSSTEVTQPPTHIKSFEYLSSPRGQNYVEENGEFK